MTRETRVAFAISAALAAMSALSVFIIFLNFFFPGTVLYVGTHRQFFRACRNLPHGAQPAAVLRTMADYVVAEGERGISEARSGRQRPTPDPGAGRYAADSTMLFYPNPRDTADWCICYFRHDRLTRTILSPD